jgi:hypothetical protein
MRLVLPDVPVGLNGTKGLLRMGWRARSRYNKYWHQLVRAAAIPTGKPPKGKQMVFVSQLRPRLLDPDNLAASCKPILDALVAWKLIKDDSEKYIALRPAQNRGKTKTTVVVIEPAANYEIEEQDAN